MEIQDQEKVSELQNMAIKRRMTEEQMRIGRANGRDGFGEARMKLRALWLFPRAFSLRDFVMNLPPSKRREVQEH